LFSLFKFLMDDSLLVDRWHGWSGIMKIGDGSKTHRRVS
jgi:hypothetical protein